MAVGFRNLVSVPGIETVRRGFVVDDDINTIRAIPIVDEPVDLLSNETIESVCDGTKVTTANSVHNPANRSAPA